MKVRAAAALALSLLASAPPVLARPESESVAAAGEKAAASARPAPQVAALARAAVSPDAAESAAAVGALRAMGPAGLDALFEAFAGALANGRPAPGSRDAEALAAWGRLSAALDAVGAQRDCYASHLYWYTDAEAARAAAQAEGRPILALRMLGRLDEEYSCANSRFFRTALYANADVSDYLREHFVLLWTTERAAPRMTIDFGDGRKIERTITGNSVHYVLDADGRPVDAIPGLYGPGAFLRALDAAASLARETSGLPDEAFRERVRAFHHARAADSAAAWSATLAMYRQTFAPTPGKGARRKPVAPRGAAVLRLAPQEAGEPAPSDAPPVTAFAPPAARAEAVTYGKMMIEFPMFKPFDLDSSPSERGPNDPIWTALAARRPDDARLDAGSRALLAYKVPAASAAPALGLSQAAYADRMAEVFENALAIDSVRNEFSLHASVDTWFEGAPDPKDLGALNAWIYSTLFLTPAADPWLGLFPNDVYTALDGGGITSAGGRD